ncbi:MAG: hypothetical protein Q9208_007013 [Pyrenodesmia sp. 3 TL-2023]
MLSYAPETLPISSRRHAIKPEEAEYLTKTLSGLCFTYNVQPLRQMRGQKNHAKADDTRTSSAADAFNLAQSTWTTIGADMVEVADGQAGTACMHPDQQQQSNAAISAAEERSYYEFIRYYSSRSSFHSRFDNKRKHAALSDEEDGMTSSPTAMDIVHPSELQCDGHVAGHGLETRGRSPTQVSNFFYFHFDAAGTILTECTDGSYCCGFDATDCCADGRGTKIDKKNGRIILGGQITRSITSTSSTALSTSTDASSASTSSTPAVAAGPLTTSPTLPSPSATSSSSGLTGGAKAGIAIGIVAGVALIAGLAFLLLKERRKRKALQNKGQSGAYGPETWKAEMDAVNKIPPQEMNAYEMGENKYHMRAELPSGHEKPQELYS